MFAPCFSRGRLALAILLLSAAGGWAAQISLPDGFVESRVTGFEAPTAMAVAPDGRLFVCEHAGAVLVVKNGVRLNQSFLQVSVHQYAERGLVGVQVDPNFAQNGYVYIYYPARTPTIHFRLSRFTARGDVAVPGSEVALLDLPKLGPSDWHNGGGIQFGPDGRLYLSVGENNLPALAQSLNSVLGKILRLNRDGSIPNDNPFYARTTGQNRAIWAVGLRNPFTLAIQPGTGRLFANDVGSGDWEEINEIVRGGNYGWPLREGAVRDNSTTYSNPLYAYHHPTSGPRSSAITGGAFYNPAHANFPAQYVGKYFFVDGETQIFSVLDPGTRTATRFATIPLVNGIATVLPLYLTVAPDGALHYVARSAKAIHTIRYVGSRLPQIGNPPDDTTVSVGDPVEFAVEAFGAPPLHFQWQRKTRTAGSFADIPGATATTLRLPAAKLADDKSQFRCVVKNTAGTVTSAAAVLTVSGNRAPVATIVEPPLETTFRAGDTIRFSGTGTDPEDGRLGPGAFTWRVDFQHLEHAHPFVPDTRGVTNGTFAIPRIGETSDQIWYRVYLTVTDAGGVANTTFRDLLPVKSSLTLQTDPPGMEVTLDQRPLTAPLTEPTVVGLTRELGAADQVVAGIPYRFVSWSDGLDATHTIDVPDAPTTYTARFEPVFTAGDNAGFVSQTVPDHLMSGQSNVITVRMVNIGSTTWRAVDNYFLGAINPPDNLFWNVNRVTLPGIIAPGETATFNFAITAPLTSGSYNLQWRMFRDGPGFFGEPSDNLALDVMALGTKANAAAFVSQSVPASLAPGSTALASITLRNVGTSAWSEAARHRLCSINPVDNRVWNVRRVALGNAVPTGGSYTFTFAIQAPAKPGNYNFQWIMIQETIERFAEATPNVVIRVGDSAGDAPEFSVQPADQTAVVGRTATFAAAATGAPIPGLRWQRKAPGGAAFADIPGATAATYTTPVLALKDSGAQYRCRATNKAGTATSAVVTVTVTDKAGAPVPKVVRFTPAGDARNVPVATAITATFSEAMNPATLTAATFNVRRVDAPVALPAKITYDAATRTATLDPTANLQTDRNYLVTVVGGAAGAKSAAGVPVTAATVVFFSKDTQPPNFSAIAVSKITGTGATITWDTQEPATSQVRYGLTTAYGQTSALKATKELHHSVTLTGLTRGKTYHFQVRGTDAYGNLGSAVDQTFKTAP